MVKTEIVEFKKKYAESLARMWNESDEGWPGGATHGIPTTSERILEEIKKMRPITTYLALADERVVGDCRISKHWEEEDLAYVALLSVHPQYHGKSFGRKLLARSVEKTTEIGFKRLDLHTWAGNMKAVPAYKKTGFFWVPNTQVYMQNFLPEILNYPLAKPFFRKHDWYDCFKRTIKVEEDDDKKNGMKVYRYSWEEDGELLNVWIDRESRTILGIENNDIYIFSYLDEHDAKACMPHTITWEIKNKKDKESKISMHISAPDGIHVEDISRTITLKKNERKILKAGFTIDAEIEEKNEDKAAHSITADFAIDGVRIPIKTGLRIKQPIEISTYPEYISLSPCTANEITFNLKNNVKKKINGKIHIVADKGLKIDKGIKSFEVEGEGHTGVPFKIVVGAIDTELLAVKAHVTFDDVKTKTKTIHVKVLDTGGTLASVEEDKRLIIENKWLRLIITLKGGNIQLFDKEAQIKYIRGFRESLGPPFWPSEFSNKRYDHKIEKRNGCVKITLYIESKEHSGLRLIREITMCSSPIIKIQQKLVNQAKEKIKIWLQLSPQRGFENARMIIPTKYGVIKEAMIDEEFPAGDRDLPKKNYLREEWSAFEGEGHVTGLIWHHEHIDEVNFGWSQMPSFILDIPEIEKNGSFELKPMYIYAGVGDWNTIRNLWNRSVKGNIHSLEKERTKGILEVATQPKPIIADKRLFKLVINNYRNKSLSGKVKVDMPQGFKIDKDEFNFSNLKIDNPLIKNIKISTTKKTPSIYSGKIHLTTELFDIEQDLPIALLGDLKKKEIVIEEEDTINIKNDLYTFKISPSFAASLFAIEKDGINNLLTSYPKPTQLSWFRPWFGGIRPIMYVESEQWEYPGKIHKEKFGYEIVKNKGKLSWDGVKVFTLIEQNKKFKGIKMEMEYLVRGGSNILAVVNRYINNTASSFRFNAGMMCYVQPNGARNGTVYFVRDKPRQRKRTMQHCWTSSDNNWAAVIDEKSGTACALISTEPKNKVGIFDLGEEGAHLYTDMKVTLKPNETKQTINYFILTKGVENAKRYKALKEMKL